MESDNIRFVIIDHNQEQHMKTHKFVISIFAGLIFMPSAFAQLSQGTLGSTSQGQLDLDLQVLDSVEISRLNDIDFGTYGGGQTGPLQRTESFCVYVNGADAYKITPSSTQGAASEDSSKFMLVGDTDGDEIMYSVKFAGAATGAASASAVDYGTQTASFLGSQYRNCGASAPGDNAELAIDIPEQEIRDATTDTYQDTLILLVNPV